VTTILVPFHQDEPLDVTGLPVPADDLIAISPALPDGDVWVRLAALYEPVAAAVADNLGATVVSGDCLVAAAVVAGVQRAGVDPSIVWFDAHGDVHTLETSTSGYLSGVSLRLLLGAHPDLLAERIGLRPLAEDRVTLVDARDLDPAEVEYLAGTGIRRTTVRELADLPDGPLILHVDTDVVDAAELDRSRFPAPGGPSTQDVVGAVHEIRATREVVAFDIACTWYPGSESATHSELLAALNAAVPPRP
jgi:arginase